MSKIVTTEDVRYIASLARLHLKDDEVTKLTEDLKGTLDYIETLQKLDVTQVEPTTHVLPLKNVYRPDVVKASLSQQDALSIAIAKHNGSFKVPQVIE